MVANHVDRGFLWARILSPLGALYGQYHARKLRQPGVRPSVPVIAIDSFTPNADRAAMMIAMIQCVQMLGHTPAVLWRGALDHVAQQVNPQMHKAAKVGDEALLLAAFTSVFQGQNRADIAHKAIAGGADILLVDGGAFDPVLTPDFSVIMTDAAHGFGNGLCWPAGPLRVPLDVGLKRADALISIGDTVAQSRFRDRWGAQIAAPQFAADYSVLQTGMAWQGMPVLAFAGVAKPEAFFAQLHGLGAHVIRAEALSNHQELTPALMRRLETSAEMAGAQLVTTELDAVRLPVKFRQNVLTLPVRLMVHNEKALQDLLREACV